MPAFQPSSMDHFEITFDLMYRLFAGQMTAIKEELKTEVQTTTSAQSFATILCLIHEVVAISEAEHFKPD